MTTLLPFQPSTMTPAQLAAVSFLARYSGRTHAQYTDSLRRWFSWCETNGLDPLIGIQRAHVELRAGPDPRPSARSEPAMTARRRCPHCPTPPRRTKVPPLFAWSAVGWWDPGAA